MDLYTAFAPLLKMSKIFGLAPFSVNGIIGKRRIKFSTFGLAVSFILLCIISYMYLFVVLLFVFESKDVFHIVHDGVIMGLVSSEVFVALESVLMCVFRGKSVFSVLAEVNTIEEQLRTLGLVPCYQKERSFVVCQVIAICVTYTTVSIFIIYEQLLVLGTHHSNKAYPFIVLGAFLLACLLVTTVQLHFVDLVLLLRQRFYLLNKELERILKHELSNTRYKEIRYLKMPYLKVLSRSPKLIVQRIAVAHDGLCDLAVKVNSIYSSYLISAFTIAIFNILLCVKNVLIPDLGHIYLGSSGLVLIYALINAIPMTLVAASCSSAVNQANLTATHVHRLLNENVSETIRQQLEKLSLQLLHRRVKFTACGLFPIDGTLIFTLVSTIFSYAVIIVQVQQVHER